MRDFLAHIPVRGKDGDGAWLRAGITLEGGDQDVEHIRNPTDLPASTGDLAEDPAFQRSASVSGQTFSILRTPLERTTVTAP